MHKNIRQLTSQYKHKHGNIPFRLHHLPIFGEANSLKHINSYSDLFRTLNKYPDDFFHKTIIYNPIKQHPIQTMTYITSIQLRVR